MAKADSKSYMKTLVMLLTLDLKIGGSELEDDKPIVTLQGAVFVYEKLLEYHKKNNRAEPTDYLFMPTLKDRTHLLLYLGWQFMYVQKLAKIEKNASNGMNRTLYSLRHTAITFRLL